MNSQPASTPAKPARAVPCTLFYPSDAKHLNQLFTGLCDLDRMGWIRLEQKFQASAAPGPSTPQHLRKARLEHAMVECAGKRLYFDFHDSQEIDEDGLRGCDFYFKRSLSLAAAEDPAMAKVFPTGLHYNVESAGFDRFAARRHLQLGAGLGRFREFWRHLPVGRRTSLSSRRFEAAPQDLPPKVLFMTRLWDPDDNSERTPEKRAHFMQLNETRANCVRRLRAALGDDFFGGVADTPLARRLCPDALVRSGDDVAKWRYIRLVQEHPICITTTGLHGSIGWKLAEYVAMGRAMISERLENVVPGGFADGTHYLSFATVDECMAQVERLIREPRLRQTLMDSCRHYYQDHLRPDRLVWRALARAMV